MSLDAAHRPRRVGRYALFRTIASGGMGSVYLGRRLQNDGAASPIVAIKGLHPHLARNVDFVTMLMDEARLVQCIEHPNVVGVHELIDDRGEIFIVMEYIHGQTLSVIARRFPAHRPPLGVALAICEGALRGLAAAHEAHGHDGRALGLIHRDISPQNIIVGTDGVTRILDFGVAKAVGRLHETREGVVKGKLAYMAPEILSESGTTQRADLYSLGVVLWELLTGTLLFFAESDAEIIGLIIRKTVPPPSQVDPSIPKAVDEVVLKALARDPAKRFASAREFADALASAAPSSPELVAPWLQAAARERLEELDRAIEGTHPDAMLTPVPRTTAGPSEQPVVATDRRLPPRASWSSRIVIVSLSLVVLALAIALASTTSNDEERGTVRLGHVVAGVRGEAAPEKRVAAVVQAPSHVPAPAPRGTGKPPGSCFVPDSKGTLHIRPECL